MRYHLYNLANKFNNPLAQRALVTATVFVFAIVFGGDNMHLFDDDPWAGGGSGG